MSKLDQAEKLPIIGIKASDLCRIPISHPEELNAILQVDRLNCLEACMSSIAELMDKYIAENMVLKDKIEEIQKHKASYTEIASHKAPTESSSTADHIATSQASISKVPPIQVNNVNIDSAFRPSQRNSDMNYLPARGNGRGRG